MGIKRELLENNKVNRENVHTEKVKRVFSKTKDAVTHSKDAVINTMDVNGDGEVNIEDVIILGMRTPGIKINRSKFLKKEFKPYADKATIEKIIETNPVRAGISKEIVEKISKEIIKYEVSCVTGISTALGVPGGLAMVATLPTDITQYYGYMLRAAQKLMYLYGFQQIDVNEEEGALDSGTINTLIICLGGMYGVAGANNAIKVMAQALAQGVNKKFMQKAVTKGVLYPIVKSICKWFGVNLTKKMCTNFFSKAIPLVGGVVGGAVTYATFKPCCEKLQKQLQDTRLSRIDYTEGEEELKLMEEIMKDIEMEEIYQ